MHRLRPFCVSAKFALVQWVQDFTAADNVERCSVGTRKKVAMVLYVAGIRCACWFCARRDKRIDCRVGCAVLDFYPDIDLLLHKNGLYKDQELLTLSNSFVQVFLPSVEESRLYSAQVFL